MSDKDMILRGDVLAAIGDAAYKHLGHDAYSNGMDAGARFQTERDLAAVRALPAVTPRPMKDAPRNGKKVLAEWPGVGWVSTEWLRDAGWGGWDSPVGHATPDDPNAPTRFIPHPTEGGSDA
jgi:hypothetical protein